MTILPLHSKDGFTGQGKNNIKDEDSLGLFSFGKINNLNGIEDGGGQGSGHAIVCLIWIPPLLTGR